jgi:hypothetical protein
MTNILAQRMQTWFTTRMPATKTRRETIYAKAERILSEPERIGTIERLNDDVWRGMVRGDHGVYEVIAASPRLKDMFAPTAKGRLACTCQAGWRRKRCSHMLVAEEMRLKGEDA